MTLFGPSSAKTVDGTNVETSSDGSDVTTGLGGGGCLDDGNTGVECIKVGKAPDDLLRVTFSADPTLLQTTDTITSFDVGFHNMSVLALYPYTTATAVSATNKITNSGGSGTLVFTLTQAFIDDLFDQGSGSFAVRIHEDAWDIITNPGDFKEAEVDADLTTTGVTRALFTRINPNASGMI